MVVVKLKEPPAADCLKTGWHSKQKHSLLESYVRVWPENVGRNSGADSPSVTFVDLHAAYGWCIDPEKGPEPWEGSAVILGHYLSQYPTRYWKRLILNTYNPDKAENALQLAALTRAMNAVGLRPGDRVLEIHNTDAEAALRAILPTINWNFPSVWVIDPYAASEMPWELLQEIIRHERKVGEMVSHPDLFLSLMTIGPVRNNRRSWPKLLGWSRDEIEARATKYAGMNERDILVELYKDRLETFYGRRPFHKNIEHVDGQIPYVVIFASDHPASFFSFAKLALPQYDKWRLGRYLGPAAELREKRVERRQEEKKERKVADARKAHGRGLDAWAEASHPTSDPEESDPPSS